ncbi:zinc finger protein 512B isoform X2 [Protopterus annectens]|uniref:zinc finger protein 512B isoform X2 n=1 Tax=Protopterus annectens TaxID=7888 RepID=UPI001CFBEE5D|nr:zinc finger protein 512B isoform X2 [Protopterus annectens]
MADTCSSGSGSRMMGCEKESALGDSSVKHSEVNQPHPLNKQGNIMASQAIGGKKKGRPRVENPDLRDIPASVMLKWKEELKSRARVKCPRAGCWLEFPSIYGLKYHYQRCQGGAVMEKLTHPCPHCEALFASKTQLEKHRAWNHRDILVQEMKAVNRLLEPAERSSGKKRFAENVESSIIKPKHTKTEVVNFQHSENGGYAVLHEKRDLLQETSMHEKSSSSGSEVEQGNELCFPEEDPERTKHRRKQKTPKKFTGEQPSISGTFGLKGIQKIEDRSLAGRPKKTEGIPNLEDMKKKPPAPISRKEVVLPGTKEEKWLQEINEKGQVLCPTCNAVTRKTIPGLKKHMEVCLKLLEALKCHHCAKQFKSKAGLDYHTLAEHANQPLITQDGIVDEQKERDRLRRVLKQMGRLKCPNKECTAMFSSLMGYQYHQKRCGKELTEAEKPVFNCKYCGKQYKSKVGHDYHVRSEHTAPTEEMEVKTEEQVEDFERTPSGRVRRQSAQVAVFHLQEIAEDELAKDWTKRKVKDDLVPDIKRLNYTRPGLPKFNPKLLEIWKNEVKEKGRVFCPNICCEALYSSVSGLKAHLANCSKGGYSAGKYGCLLCHKQFNSESGVKYHILRSHSENWFRPSSSVSKKNKMKKFSTLVNDKQKSTTGKKRGRKPKERPLELLPKEPLRPERKTYTRKPFSSMAHLLHHSNVEREKGNRLFCNKKRSLNFVI